MLVRLFSLKSAIYLLSFSLVIFGLAETALAEMQISLEGASAQVDNTYYFSNISTFSSIYNGINYFISDPIGRNCDPILNVGCKNLTDKLTVTVTGLEPGVGDGRLFLIPYDYAIYSYDLARVASTPGKVLDVQPIGPSGVVKFKPISFSELCETAGIEPGSENLDSNCQTAYGNGTNITSFHLNVVSDSDGRFLEPESDEIQSVTLSIVPGIPASSSSASSFGLFKFTATSITGGVKFDNIATDNQFPSNENGIGVKKVRFYYFMGDKNLNPVFFHRINLLSPYFETDVDTSGNLSQTRFDGLESQHIYYFRTALVDRAGNVGFFTSPDDDDLSHAAQPL